jgi:hypothetical protein
MGLRVMLPVLVCLAGGWASSAQTNPPPQILFLHLVISNQIVSLVDSNLRPGVLKPAPEADSTGLFYEQVSESGATLWKGSTADPTVRHLEFEDPTKPGELQRKTVQLDKAEFMLRIPFHPTARRLNFFKLPAGPPGTVQPAVTRVSFGSITLPSDKHPSQ